MRIQTGGLPALRILVQGGTHGLLGHIVIIDGKAGFLHAAIDPRLKMPLVAVLEGSVDDLHLLRSMRRLDADEIRLMHIAMAGASLSALSKAQRKVIGKFMAANTHRALTSRDLLIFLHFAGPSQKVVARDAALIALKHAYEFGDVSLMVQCVNAISAFSPAIVTSWFSRYFPVSFRMKAGVWTAKRKKGSAFTNRLGEAANNLF